MTYSYFLKLKSYINTYISVTYTEPTVRNVKPQGNHNPHQLRYVDGMTVRNVKPQGNHNNRMTREEVSFTVRNVKPQGNHNNTINSDKDVTLLETLNRKVITTDACHDEVLD